MANRRNSRWNEQRRLVMARLWEIRYVLFIALSYLLVFGWLFAGTALLLGGLGIYLGRFSRFNSWDLVLNPTEVLYDIAIRFVHPISNISFFGFTLLFSAFLLVVYLTVTSIRPDTTNE